MIKLEQPKSRLILIAISTCMLLLLIFAETARKSHQTTVNNIKIHQANLIARVHGIFTPLQHNRALNRTEIRHINQNITEALLSVDFFLIHQGALQGKDTETHMLDAQALFLQLQPLIKDLSRNRQQLSLEHRAQSLIKDLLQSALRQLIHIGDSNMLSGKNKQDLKSIDKLIATVTESLVYENLLSSAQQADPVMTFEIKNKLIDSIDQLIETPINRETYKEPRIRAQARQVQLTIKKSARDHSEFYSKSQTAQELIQTLQTIRNLQKTPEQLQITTLVNSSNTPFYTRSEFQFIHAVLTIALTLGLGFSSQSSTRRVLMDSTQRESERKRELMAALSAFDLEKRNNATTVLQSAAPTIVKNSTQTITQSRSADLSKEDTLDTTVIM